MEDGVPVKGYFAWSLYVLVHVPILLTMPSSQQG